MAQANLSQMKAEGKKLPLSSAPGIYIQFLLTVLILLPFLILLIPFVVISLLIKTIHTKLFSKVVYETVPKLSEKSQIIPQSKPREFDLILFGATGFTGQLAATYLAKKYGTREFKWAIAGRRKDALEKIRNGLIQHDAGLSKLPIIIADSSKPESLRTMVQSTKVVITTTGPFDRYGSELVQFCAENGTHYADITGETDWVRKMIDRYDDIARESGARIVSFCGHDCIPWDLITLECATTLKKKGEKLAEVKIYDEILAGPSGGTLETVFHILENRVKVNTSLGFDPMLKELKPKARSAIKTVVNNPSFLTYSNEFKRWVGPFLMAAVNGNCVRRSNAILNYGDNLKYSEATVYSSFLAGFVTLVQLMILGASLVVPPLQWFLRKFILPAPGQGPSVEEMDQGFLNVNAIARGSNGTIVKAELYFPTDPGYRDTARMLVEAGLALALQDKEITSTPSGGIYTPATGIGSILTQRLMKTGCSFHLNVENESSSSSSSSTKSKSA